MDYQDSIEYLLSFADFERSGRFQDRPDVAPVLALLRELGDPHLGRDTVHIAGSKGKGSTAAMVEAILRAAGRSTGLYTSPHLHSYTERIRIDGEPIAESEWARHAESVRAAVESGLLTETLRQAQGERKLVTFDLLTALAFLAFRERAVDVQVVEVGLGGRVDSTNVFRAPRQAEACPTKRVDPGRQAEACPTETGEAASAGVTHVCTITAIGLEHTDVLGDTLEQIAAEKAGIIRPCATVVIGPQEYPEAREVIRRTAEAAGCEMVDVAATYSWRRLSHDLHGQTFRLEGPRGARELRIPLLGSHQLENAATAIACVDALGWSDRFRSQDEAIALGLAGVRWPGRFEVLSKRPIVIADGAHSPDSARRLRETLTDYLSCRKAFLIVGVSAGKDVESLARELAPLAGRVLAVQADHPRALAADEIAAAFARLGVDAEAGGSVAEALDRALAATPDEGVICLTGSLFAVAEGRAHLNDRASASE